MGLYDEHGMVNKKCDRCGNGRMLMEHPHNIGRTARYTCPKCGYSTGGGELRRE